jgi:hypothetical protein
VLHGDEPGPLRPRGVVVAPPDQARTDPVLLERLLDGLASAPMLDPVTVGDLFDLVDAEGEDVGEPLVREVTASDARIGITASEVADARSSLQGLDAVVIPTGPTATPQLSDLVLLAEADGLATEERRRYLGAVGDGVAERLGSVRVVDGASFRLPDSEGTIPLTIVRDGGTPLSVRVLLESTKLEFDDATATQPGSVSYELELTNENTPLVVPVRVRSPGTFPLLITITSPDGRLELVRDQVTIHSTAFSGVGVALSAGAGLFLLLWWARHWRTVRRAKRLVPVP